MLPPFPLSIAISEGDRLRIVQEHDRLTAFLHDLQHTCSEFDTSVDCKRCGREKMASCQGLLVSFQFDFIELIEEHFEHEEELMRRCLASPEDDAYFRHHQAEHTRLLQEIRNVLIPQSTQMSHHGQTAAAIRLLQEKITEIFSQHTLDFDQHLLK
ncbi:MAG: hypothetical protein N2Z69_04435 [Methylophilaceae bacterium]|nr:hypothetical protein [Methylophilaceae bacterium]